MERPSPRDYYWYEGMQVVTNTDYERLSEFADFQESEINRLNQQISIEKRFRMEDAIDHQGDQIMFSESIKKLKSEINRLKEENENFKLIFYKKLSVKLEKILKGEIDLIEYSRNVDEKISVLSQNKQQ